MRHSGFLVVALAASCVVPAPDAGFSEAEQGEWDGGPSDPDGEVIVVEGGFDGWPGWWFPGPDTVPDPGDTGDGYGGGGSGPGGGGVDGIAESQPQRKNCMTTENRLDCLDCCDYNADVVDGWACRRMPNKTPEEKDARRRCWEDLEKERQRCYKEICRGDPVISCGA